MGKMTLCLDARGKNVERDPDYTPSPWLGTAQGPVSRRGERIAPVPIITVESAQATKPRRVQQVCPMVLEPECIACLRVFRIGLKSGGRRCTVRLGIPNGLDRPLDAAVCIHSEGNFGVATAQARFSRRLCTRSSVP